MSGIPRFQDPDHVPAHNSGGGGGGGQNSRNTNNNQRSGSGRGTRQRRLIYDQRRHNRDRRQNRGGRGGGWNNGQGYGYGRGSRYRYDQRAYRGGGQRGGPPTPQAHYAQPGTVNSVARRDSEEYKQRLIRAQNDGCVPTCMEDLLRLEEAAVYVFELNSTHAARQYQSWNIEDFPSNIFTGERNGKDWTITESITYNLRSRNPDPRYAHSMTTITEVQATQATNPYLNFPTIWVDNHGHKVEDITDKPGYHGQGHSYSQIFLGHGLGKWSVADFQSDHKYCATALKECDERLKALEDEQKQIQVFGEKTFNTKRLAEENKKTARLT